MEPITLAALGFGAYYLIKKGGVGGASTSIPNFSLTASAGKATFEPDDKGLAGGPSLLRFEADMRGDSVFATNPGLYVAVIMRADLGITDNIWGCGLLMGKVDAPGANPKMVAAAWDPGAHMYGETASDQLADNMDYHLVVDSAVDGAGQRYLRYALSNAGGVLRDTGMFPVDAGFDTSKRGLVLARAFGNLGALYFSNVKATWSRYNG